MDKGRRLLGELVMHTKYCNFLPEENRRETFNQVVDRVFNMFGSKYPNHLELVEECKQAVLDKKVLPSMRNMNFGGKAVEQHNARSFNCSFTHITNTKAFADAMYLLLCGVGVGYSVQKHHVNQLPVITGNDLKEDIVTHVITDDIEGWADSIKMLLDNYMDPLSDELKFDYTAIRPKGSLIRSSGSKAPGPQPLIKCHKLMREVLDGSIGRKLKPIEAHDLMCILADAVLAGGVRRSAMISLFSHDDMEMLLCKSGEFWKIRPERSRANNSCLLLRGKVTYSQFMKLWELVEHNRTGEPAFIWTNNLEWGYNPCVEASLRMHTFCNLTSINARLIKTQKQLEYICGIASAIGTMQAGFTDFGYLAESWKINTDIDALIGVSFTGITNSNIQQLDLRAAAEVVVEMNKHLASEFGINQAARTTLIKPEGKTSCVFESDSGIHDGHGPYYIRTMRCNKSEGIYKHLIQLIPDFIEDEIGKEKESAVISFPCTTPKQYSTKKEITAIQFLERVKHFSLEWVKPGHVRGVNTHNVSATVDIKGQSGSSRDVFFDSVLGLFGKRMKSVQRSEWHDVGQWLWNNRDVYNGLSVLPHDGGIYQQAPFQSITEQEYNRMNARFPESLNLNEVIESFEDMKSFDNIACSGGACEVTYI